MTLSIHSSRSNRQISGLQGFIHSLSLPARLARRLTMVPAACCLLLWCCTAWADEEAVARNTPTEIDFARDIRPLLSDRCFLCHGPDAEQRASDLRLDVQSSAHQLAIKPSDAANSELVRRITSDDADELMPPPDSNLKLNAAEQELLRHWIDQGASTSSIGHLSRPSVPQSLK
ncbi:MAG: c-type cytochrome domain-containing protein [Pirellulaceae bacterium]